MPNRLILILLFGLCWSAQGAEIFVDPSGTDSAGCGDIANKCATLQYAVSISKAEDTITMGTGVYKVLNTTIPTSLTIKAGDKQQVTWNCNGEDLPAGVNLAQCILITAPLITVQDITIMGNLSNMNGLISVIGTDVLPGTFNSSNDGYSAQVPATTHVFRNLYFSDITFGPDMTTTGLLGFQYLPTGRPGYPNQGGLVENCGFQGLSGANQFYLISGFDATLTIREVDIMGSQVEVGMNIGIYSDPQFYPLTVEDLVVDSVVFSPQSPAINLVNLSPGNVTTDWVITFRRVNISRSEFTLGIMLGPLGDSAIVGGNNVLTMEEVSFHYNLIGYAALYTTFGSQTSLSYIDFVHNSFDLAHINNEEHFPYLVVNRADQFDLMHVVADSNSGLGLINNLPPNVDSHNVQLYNITATNSDWTPLVEDPGMIYSTPGFINWVVIQQPTGENGPVFNMTDCSIENSLNAVPLTIYVNETVDFENSVGSSPAMKSNNNKWNVTVLLTRVTFKNNQPASSTPARAMYISAQGATVTMSNCHFNDTIVDTLPEVSCMNLNSQKDNTVVQLEGANTSINSTGSLAFQMNLNSKSSCQMKCDSKTKGMCPSSGSNLTWLWVTMGLGIGFIIIAAVTAVAVFSFLKWRRSKYEQI